MSHGGKERDTMEWETFGSVAAVLAVLVGIATPIIKLNANITKLNTLLEMVNKEMEQVKEDNANSHGRIWSRLDQQEKELGGHETRLQLLEKH